MSTIGTVTTIGAFTLLCLLFIVTFGRLTTISLKSVHWFDGLKELETFALFLNLFTNCEELESVRLKVDHMTLENQIALLKQILDQCPKLQHLKYSLSEEYCTNSDKLLCYLSELECSPINAKLSNLKELSIQKYDWKNSSSLELARGTSASFILGRMFLAGNIRHVTLKYPESHILQYIFQYMVCFI